MSDMTYSPIMICDHGSAGTVSFHAASKEAHNKGSHSPEFPMSARLATKEELERAGWDVTNYPESIGC